MHKTASPQDVRSELREILAYCATEQPSRATVAAKLSELADKLASPVWVQKLKAKLQANPLYWVPVPEGSAPHTPNPVMCLDCLGGKPPKGSKKIPLHAVTNYNEFRTCEKCKVTYR